MRTHFGEWSVSVLCL